MLILVTACGKSKESKILPAWKLYKSSRIRYLKKVADQKGIPFYILSAKYGLIYSEEIIEPYELLLTEAREQEVIGQVIEVLKSLKKNGLKLALYYKGGARKEYYELFKKACSIVGVDMITYGSGYMRDINKTKMLIEKYNTY